MKDWSTTNELTIYNPGSTLTNYQLPLTINISPTAKGANAKTIYAYGNATQTTLNGKYCVSLDGTEDRLVIPYAQLGQIGASDFTIEFKYKRNTTGSRELIFCQSDLNCTDASTTVIVEIYSNNILRTNFVTSGAVNNIITTSFTWTDITNFHDVAYVKSGTNLYAFVDGTQVGTISVAGLTPNTNTTNPWVIGRCGDYAGYYCNGYISEFRISNYARYTSNYTPQTTEFVPDQYTKLLLHFDNDQPTKFFDDSDSGVYISDLNNDASDIRFTQGSTLLPYWIRNDNGGSPTPPDGKVITPFGNTTQTTFNNIKCISFDGSGDYLSIPDSDDWYFPDWVFTIELRVKFNNVSVAQCLISQITNTSAFWQIAYDISTMSFSTPVGGVGYNCSYIAGTEYQITIVGDGTYTYIFEDGILKNSMSISGLTFPGVSADLRIGMFNYGSGYYLNGYLRDIRISKGIARHTSDFTPPTNLISDQYTKLLLHGNNINAPSQFIDESTGKYECYVKVPLLTTGNNKIKVFSGNNNALTTSNGDATFELFDHFNGSTLNTNKWIKDSVVTASLSNSVVTLSNATVGTYGLSSLTKISQPNTITTIRSRRISALAGYEYCQFTNISIQGNNAVYTDAIAYETAYYINSQYGYYALIKNSSSTGVINAEITDRDVFNTRSIFRNASKTKFINGSNVITYTNTAYIPIIPLYVMLITCPTTSGTAQWAIDFIYVRNCVDVEPIAVNITSIFNPFKAQLPKNRKSRQLKGA